ncbi:DUF5825 family protein [Streptomyces sp. NPDC052077]|uniref:DUF5825 family protein n=1 Tax=Streptomyces sp. NPDC052077 TaxID=3154757 RepID=UPI0034357A3E
MSAVPSPPPVLAWRDHDPAACGLPGMFLGEVDPSGDPGGAAERLWRLGARRVRLPGTVDLTGEAGPERAARTVAALSLVRDLTARAVLVDWELRLGLAVDAWRVLCHLQPPRRLDGHDGRTEPEGAERSDGTAGGGPAGDPEAAGDPGEALRAWRRGHYLCKCLWRVGPGFVQIRDRRWGELRRFTADEPEYRTAIDRLAYGAPAGSVRPAVLDDFRGERLVLDIGVLSWWVPYRVDRWLQESMTI